MWWQGAVLENCSPALHSVSQPAVAQFLHLVNDPAVVEIDGMIELLWFLVELVGRILLGEISEWLSAAK